MPLPPPPHRLIYLLLLLLAGLAAPAVAQTTVTSSGRDGDTACLKQTEVNAASLPITALTTARVTYTAPPITWNEYVGRLGDTVAPTSATLLSVIKNARTDTEVGRKPNALTSGATFPGESQTISNLVAKTSYYLEVKVTSTSNEDIVFARRCFMTGGNYTMNPDPSSSQGRNSGCFTISPLTQQDVRNCWCGRKTTLPLFSSTQDNTDFLNMWGCR